MLAHLKFTRWLRVANKIEIGQLGSALNDALSMLKQGKEKQVDSALRDAFIGTAETIRIKTPADTGRARANWFLTKIKPSKKIVKSNTSSQSYSSKLSGRVLGNRFFLTNNLPYIKTLEYGGYPKDVKKGTKKRKGGGYEIRSSGGYSKQAPNGMVRITLKNFPRRLKKALRVYSK